MKELFMLVCLLCIVNVQVRGSNVDEDSLSTNWDNLPDPEPESEFPIPVEEGKTIPKSMLIPEEEKSRNVRQLGGCPNPALNDPFLYFANRQFLVLMNTDVSGLRAFTSPEVPPAQYMTAADYDMEGCYIYWSDVVANHIARAKMDGSDYSVLISTGVTNVDGLAWNWVNESLYWTDAEERDIEIYYPATGDRQVLLETGVAGESIPRAIVLDPIVSGKMYWTDWGSVPRIERASLDGTSREVLHSTGLVWPNGLAIDLYTQIIYWIDGGLDRLECSHTDGSGRRLLINQFIRHPFGLDFCNDNLYWSDWEQKAIRHTALYHTTRQPTFTITDIFSGLFHLPMGVKCVSPSKQPQAICSPACPVGASCVPPNVCVPTSG